jgi:hypothetical protein
LESVVPCTAPVLFDLGAVFLGAEDFFFQTTRSGAVLAASFLCGIFLFLPSSLAGGLYAVTELDSGPVAIGGLLALLLAADFHSCGQVAEDHGAGSLVDFLASRATTSDENLLQVLLPDTQSAHPFVELLSIGIRGHEKSLSGKNGKY